MYKITLFLVLALFTSFIQAKEKASFYQIDLIVFAHQQTLPGGPSLHSTLASSRSSDAIPLQMEVSKNLSPYHLLPSSSSQLREEYWALGRKPQYRVLLHYSWLQPLNNQRAIILSKVQRDGWAIEGRLLIQRGTYYLLNSELLISAPDSQTPFVLAQKQRLKGGSIYYLDHPRIGILIKVHDI